MPLAWPSSAPEKQSPVYISGRNKQRHRPPLSLGTERPVGSAPGSPSRARASLQCAFCSGCRSEGLAAGPRLGSPSERDPDASAPSLRARLLRWGDHLPRQEGPPASLLSPARQPGRSGHPRYFNQLSTGLDMVGLAADWLTSTANTNMFTYEIAPVFVLLEYVTLRKMREMIGWPGGCGDGIFSPGGAISNMYAMLIARFKMFPEVKEKGMAAIPRLVALTSEHSHFSVKKGAAALGIGTDSVILIRCDERGKMIPSDLERRIIEAKQKGFVPFLVSATAGTTVYGAFDPLLAIADICKKYKIWMHVDAAWGGGLLMSRKHKWKLNGVERANSVTWNPHKMMGVPLQCSALLVREEGLMQSCNQMHASYLFQQDKHYDLSYDTGDKALQCGRHVDVFKLWLMWRAKGTTGFEAQIDKCLELAEYLYNKIKNREGYEMVFDGKPQHTNVCFWYVPPSLRSMEDNEERMNRLLKVAPVIKARMMEYGTTMVSYQPLGDKVNFFRMVISNPAATHQDIDFLIEEIERLGQDL
ncbi:glutamate decarboxylase 2 isoform X2 [Natator depressus]|uniref:glutamate decarboxylase 2 isoform X2 n=1 Tax=Natator depressus TaxID=27790 RepID=UPI003EB93BD2